MSYAGSELVGGGVLLSASNLATAQWLTGTSGVDTITASVATTVFITYAAGQTFRFVSAGANTGAATLNINSAGAKSITKNGTTALVAGDIPSGTVAEVVYDGTQFQLNNQGGMAKSGANSDITSMTGLGLPTVLANPLRVTDLQTQTFTAYTTAGTSTAFTLTTLATGVALTTNERWRVNFHTTAGATPTLNRDGKGAKSLKIYDAKGAKIAASANSIITSMLADVEYDGTDYVILNQLPTAPRAWVQFNGTGTPAIVGNFNVSSITDNGVGDWTVNFTTALADANYSAQVSQERVGNGTTVTIPEISTTAAPTASAVRVGNSGSGATVTKADAPIVCVAVFR